MDLSMKSKCIIDSYSTKRWYFNDKLHREDGPAVEWFDGNKYWCINGKLHREDGPAVESSNGYKAWCINGKYHRTDGPAMELSNGYKYWYLNGKKLTFKQWLGEIWDTLSKEDQKKYAFNGFKYEK